MVVMSTECPICGKFPTGADYRRGRHVCPPMYYCQFDRQRGNGDEPERIFADDASTAAEKFVEQYDKRNVEFTEEATVYATALDGTAYKVTINGELVRIYRSNREEEIPRTIEPEEEEEEL